MKKYLIIIILNIISINTFANQINLYCDGVEIELKQFSNSGIRESKDKLFSSLNLIILEDTQTLIYNNLSFKYRILGNTFNFYYLDPKKPIFGDTYMLGFNLNRVSGDFKISELRKFGENNYSVDRLFNCYLLKNKKRKF